MEKHYVFLKGNQVETVLVFSEMNDKLAKIICKENAYDSFIWMDDKEIPSLMSVYDEVTGVFTAPVLIAEIFDPVEA